MLDGSIFKGTDRELLPKMFDFYAPSFRSVIEVRDVTANTRKMWKGVKIKANVRFYDIDEGVHPDVACSWERLPDPDDSVDVIVFDPPHLPVSAVTDKSTVKMITDYGLTHSVEGDNISEMFDGFLVEAKRVLKPDGLIFAKIKDYIHNHRYQWNHEYFNCACRENGLTPCDMIIKQDPSAGKLRSSKWKISHHVRNAHCYWIIVRNSDRCEARKDSNTVIKKMRQVDRQPSLVDFMAKGKR